MSDEIKLIHGDCLEKMGGIEKESIDLVLCDPPYGTTQCKWDAVIDLDEMWLHIKRIVKIKTAVVLMAGQPFTSILICSKLEMFKYCWVWNKINRATGYLNAKKQPLKQTEDICIFSANTPIYKPQMTKGTPYVATGSKISDNYGKQTKSTIICKDGMRYPRSIINIKADNKGVESRVHPTQKPVALMEYLIKTYSNEGDVVLDFAMGSGTTGVACKNLNRRFIGIEKEKKYFEIAKNRISNERYNPEALKEIGNED